MTYFKKNSLIIIAIPVIMLFSCAQLSNNTNATKEQQTKIKTPSAQILKYGLYKVTKESPPKNDSAGTAGKITNKPVIKFIEQTDRIPIKPGNTFAFEYRISGINKNLLELPIRRSLKHPEIQQPDGTKSSWSEQLEHKAVKNGEILALEGYSFVDEYEMVAGEWTFQLWYQDNMLIEKKFITYRPN